MPIGVPRIIYCWGEELPAQWTDIYNFIFRRRMIFLMQYLDDELCNQICGLLINIHMEDRSKELEQKEMEQSGLFKNSANRGSGSEKIDPIAKAVNSGLKKEKSFDDLLASDEDLEIDENSTLEQYALQKITMDWFNWNAQFFNYSDEPYLFYLAELFAKNERNEAQMLYRDESEEMTKFINFAKNMMSSMNAKESSQFGLFLNKLKSDNSKQLNIYSPFRAFANFAPKNYRFNDVNPNVFDGSNFKDMFDQDSKKNILSNLSKRKFSNNQSDSQHLNNLSEKALGQRRLRKGYIQDRIGQQITSSNRVFGSIQKSSDFLDFSSYNDSYNEFRDYYRKQAEKTMTDEESKKVFVIINSFGGSVGNGITVHDALQFIKAGSLTLALGVAASAASLALAGGTIGERYVTEGCHVMIHQPEGGLQGQASDIWIDSQEIMKIRLDVAEIYSLSTYRPRHKILRDLDRDFYLTATETIYYGLADEIATNEVMHEIIEMTNKVWDSHDSKQQRLLETRESATSGFQTQDQS